MTILVIENFEKWCKGSGTMDYACTICAMNGKKRKSIGFKLQHREQAYHELRHVPCQFVEKGYVNWELVYQNSHTKTATEFKELTKGFEYFTREKLEAFIKSL